MIFAIVPEKVFDEEGTDGHAHVAVDVGDAVPPARRLLLLTVEHRVESLLQLLVVSVQIVQTVPHETPQQIVVHSSAIHKKNSI